MIIRRPSKVRMDPGDPSSLLARNSNDSEWTQRSRVKRQGDVLPCAIDDPVPPPQSVVPSPPPSPSSSSSSDSAATVTPSFPPVTPSFPPVTPSFPPTTPSFPPTVSSSFPPVVTSPTPLPSSTGLDPTWPSSSTPLETIVLSSSSTSPSPLWSAPLPGLVISLPTFTTQPYLLVTSPNPTPTANSPVLPPTVTPTNTDFWKATDGFDSQPEPSLMTTNTNEIAPDPSLDSVSQGGTVSRNRMIGAITGSVLVAGLVLLGVIFYLRRRMSRKSLGRVVDATHPMSNVSSPRSAPSRVKEQRGGGIIAQDQNPFLDPSNAAMRNPTPTVTAGQKQRGHVDRYSQVSTTSSASKSIRFVVPGSYHSPTNSRSSRVTISVTPTDMAHTVTSDPPTPPQSPVSVKTPVDHSAPWRGTNLSNIINAARGVKT